MAYEDETKTAILARMLAASDPTLDQRQGSPTFDLLSPAAMELAQAYAELDNALRWGFVNADGTGAYGAYLDLRAGELGLTRKAAVKAVGSVTFTGPNGTVIPIGTQVSTGNVYFVTTAAGTTASGTVTVTAEALVGSAAGNVTIGAINLVAGPLVGIVSVTNAATFNGGADTESDADLTARYFERARKPATSGNANQYRQWALEIAGISDAKVFPLWNGLLTVKVALLDTDKRAPVSGKVAEVAAYIETVRPIGATVSIVAATEFAINVTGTFTLAAGYTLTQARAQILAGLTAYLKTLAFTDATVRYTQIANVVLNTAAVDDYSGLTVNGGAVNVVIAAGSVAIAGTVT
ncbi:baseplate J/gp47 family protein [Paenibacillus agricola]|uniref:Baseplate J/gp47 family protein n=1 Tax=Paenibacillus agricola TaxID=2716264 RepID=A0ABX0J8D6_9BACL|nr:baseplate J/gp47 family protein [Paenibacillus agricola]NHN31122.1 baseplate J/gp47 family protein [Paenibacillus agricola]